MAYIQGRDHEGQTALFAAAESGWDQVTQHLVERGADPTVRDADGKTAARLRQVAPTGRDPNPVGRPGPPGRCARGNGGLSRIAGRQTRAERRHGHGQALIAAGTHQGLRGHRWPETIGFGLPVRDAAPDGEGGEDYTRGQRHGEIELGIQVDEAHRSPSCLLTLEIDPHERPRAPSSCALRLQRGQHAFAAEGCPAQANTGGIVDRIGDRGDQRLMAAFPCPVRRQIGAVRIRIAVDEHDVDASRVCPNAAGWGMKPN